MELRRRARFWQPAARAAGTATTSTRHLGRRSGLQEIPAPTQRLPTDAPTKEDCRREKRPAYSLRQQGASPSSPGYTAAADELNRERSSAAGNQVVMILVRQCAFVGVLEETRDIGGSPSRSRCRHNATIMIDTSDEDNDTLSPGSSPHPRRGLQRSLKQGGDRRPGGFRPRAATCDNEGGAIGASWLAPKRLPL